MYTLFVNYWTAFELKFERSSFGIQFVESQSQFIYLDCITN